MWKPKTNSQSNGNQGNGKQNGNGNKPTYNHQKPCPSTIAKAMAAEMASQTTSKAGNGQVVNPQVTERIANAQHTGPIWRLR
ncbi:hypothetical protein O9929_11395 [Vibrio lentus]|nr:hypothetical protein [Vibrio lentus]